MGKPKKYMLCKLQQLCVNQKARFAHPEGHVNHYVPSVSGQAVAAVPSLASPRVYLSPRGAGARLPGPDKMFFGDLILQISVLGPVLPQQ